MSRSSIKAVGDKWTALWRAYLDAKRTGDQAAIEKAREAVQRFDKRHNLPTLACVAKNS